MSDGKNADSVTIEPIQHNITAASEVDQPFPKLSGHVFDRPTHARLMGEDFDPGADCLNRPAGGGDIL